MIIHAISVSHHRRRFSGSVLARELVSQLNCSVDIWEEGDHPAGNCYTYEDTETGITVHKYGPHIFKH